MENIGNNTGPVNTNLDNIQNIPQNSGGNNNKQIVAAIIVAGIIIAGAILLKDSKQPIKIENNTKEENTAVKSQENTDIRAIDEIDHILGNKNAEIFIVEYSDTECPYCKNFHNTMHKIITENTKVAWIYRHYPIPQLHQKAFNEALATECAWEWGGNDVFWSYTDEIYKRTSSNDGLPPEELTKIAEDLQININTFSACLDTEKYTKKVENDILDGEGVGINGTPTSFIVKNGKVIDKIEGAQPIEVVREKIKNALRK